MTDETDVAAELASLGIAPEEVAAVAHATDTLNQAGFSVLESSGITPAEGGVRATLTIYRRTREPPEQTPTPTHDGPTPEMDDQPVE